jgi:hypothetical protein
MTRRSGGFFGLEGCVTDYIGFDIFEGNRKLKRWQ